MRVILSSDLQCDFNDKYLLDKVLHDRFHIADEVLSSSNTKAIFLIRKPLDAIRSILTMRQTIYGQKYSIASATDYYCARLVDLKRIAAKVAPASCFFVESDALVDDTSRILEELTIWLGLSVPLRPEYSVFTKTGKPGHGDQSENIQSGRISTTKGHPEISLPDADLRQAMTCYEDCMEHLEHLHLEGRNEQLLETANS